MSTTYLGGLSVAQAVPLVSASLAQVDSLVAPTLAKASGIEAQLSLPFTPPDPTAMAAALATAVTNLTAALAALPAADASARVQLAADLANLHALIGPAKALVAQLAGLASVGGLHAYTYDGNASSLGGELGARVGAGLPGGGGAGAPVHALLLVTESPSAWAALGTVVRAA